MEEKTREPQYIECVNLRNKEGFTQFGLMSNFVWHSDPKRLVFLLSRYKFVSKMLSGSKNVIEIGCADAFASRIVLQEVENLTVIDFDPLFVKDAQEHMAPHWKFCCREHDILEGPYKGEFDGAYALDVIEHIPQAHEELFIHNISSSLTEHGVLIIGTPSIESQVYASPGSKDGHVNCKEFKQLRDLLIRFFHNVFIFSMNDEVVHTGFAPMAHYFLAVCCSKRAGTS